MSGACCQLSAHVPFWASGVPVVLCSLLCFAFKFGSVNPVPVAITSIYCYTWLDSGPFIIVSPTKSLAFCWPCVFVLRSIDQPRSRLSYPKLDHSFPHLPFAVDRLNSAFDSYLPTQSSCSGIAFPALTCSFTLFRGKELIPV
jgi:hypothetical protein